MKKFGFMIVGMLLFVGLSGPANAGTIILEDTTTFTASGTTDSGDLLGFGGSSANYLSGIGDYVAWAHNFVFDPPAASILSAIITVTLRDDETNNCDFLAWEIALGIADDGTWALGEVDTRDYTYDVNVNLLDDGQFAVLVKSLGGDFYIDKSKLDITYQAVPDSGSAILLLGIGIGAVSVISRRWKY